MTISRCSLGDAVRKIKSGELDIEDYVNELCDRIDAHEPEVLALIPEEGRRERLLNRARGLKEKYPNIEDRPIFFGIPLGSKDLFRVDGFETRAGSNFSSERLYGDEATTVTKMRELGALVLGKTVTTEFAYFEPGPTRNPHNLDHTPGGSSSGSAAAVAAGFCPVAFGTQTIGSVIRPASYCGIYGFKPSYDRVSRSGVIPFSDSADHVGYFAQDMEGIELLSSVLCEDWQVSRAANMNTEDKFTIGVPSEKYLNQASDEVLAFFNNQLAMLEEKGHKVVRTDLFEDIERINETHNRMIAAEMAGSHSNLIVEGPDLYRNTTKDLILRGQTIPWVEVISAIKGRLIIREYIKVLSENLGVDVWASPSTSTTAPAGISATGSPIMNLPWTYAGVPVITVPRGFSSDNLPLGMQFSGVFMEDERLLDVAHAVCPEAVLRPAKLKAAE